MSAASGGAADARGNPVTAVENPAGIQRSSLVTRVMTAAVYGIVLLTALWFGGVYLGVVVGVIAALAAAEFFAITRREHRLPNEVLGVLAALAMPVAAALWAFDGLIAVVSVLLGVAIVWHVLFSQVQTADTALTVFGALYTGLSLSFLVLVRGFDSGQIVALALVFSVWANDTLAYFVGSSIGKHKLAPTISPKKSWEGLVGGTLGSLLVWVVVAFLPSQPITLPWAIVTGLVVGAAVILGDLAESRFKREAGVKDSGTLLPGHGGFLDRHDSLILVSLVGWCVLMLAGVL